MENTLRSTFIAHFRKKVDTIFATSGFKSGEVISHRLKSDNTPVSKVDQLISKSFENTVERFYPGTVVVDEEREHNLTFPCFVIDPLDGTKEFVQGIGEFATAVAFLNSADLGDSKNWGWVYNPYNKIEVQSFESVDIPYERQQDVTCLISRTEYAQKLFCVKHANIKLEVVGSIAYKLALLALSRADLVISKKPKNIWDIAAGTLILVKRSCLLYQAGIEVSSINEVRLGAPLVWCRKDFYQIAMELSR